MGKTNINPPNLNPSNYISNTIPNYTYSITNYIDIYKYYNNNISEYNDPSYTIYSQILTSIRSYDQTTTEVVDLNDNFSDITADDSDITAEIVDHDDNSITPPVEVLHHNDNFSDQMVQ